MTFAAVGGLIQADVSTVSITPGGVGDLILFEVVVTGSRTIFCSALSAGNIAWAPFGASYAAQVAAIATSQVFAGRVISTSAAVTTMTFSGGSPSGIRAGGQEFSSTKGGWVLDVQGNLDSGGTTQLPSLTPVAAGEIYFMYEFDGGTAAAGPTSGYTYNVDNHGNAVVFNPACTASAQAPVLGAGSSSQTGIAVLVRESTPSSSRDSSVVPIFAAAQGL